MKLQNEHQGSGPHCVFNKSPAGRRTVAFKTPGTEPVVICFVLYPAHLNTAVICLVLDPAFLNTAVICLILNPAHLKTADMCLVLNPA